MMLEAGQLALSVPGSPEGLGDAVESFERFSAAHGLSDSVRRSIQVVLDELLSNTVRHGKDGTREITIDLDFRLGTETLQVKIIDDGTPFNPLDAGTPDTTRPLEDRPEGGLGLMFVRHLVDEISYVRAGGRNHVILGKRLDARRTHA